MKKKDAKKSHNLGDGKSRGFRLLDKHHFSNTISFALYKSIDEAQREVKSLSTTDFENALAMRALHTVESMKVESLQTLVMKH